MTRKKPDAETASKIVDLFDALKSAVKARSTEAEPAELPAARDFPEQFAAGMQDPLGEPDPVSNPLVVGKQRRFRAGDVVKHEPSGEEWLLATDEGNGLVWTQGWPESLEEVDELSLVEAATDDERLKALRVFATHDGPRGRSARVQLEAEPVAPADPFDTADYYDACSDTQCNSWRTTPQEALAALFADYITAGQGASEAIAGHLYPMRVEAYRNRPIPEEWFALTADRLANQARDMFDETELLGNTVDGISRVTVDQLAAGAKLIEPALRQMFRDVTPWHCERVATREYSAEQVAALLNDRVVT